MQIGIVGKTNTGKSSFFKAATLIDVEISNRIFCTIKPNVGVGYVTAPCPCRELKVRCNPQNSKCMDGLRLVPVKLLDVAGLVPGAHEGKGLGNQFLNDLTPADALVHVVDASGTTDAGGNLTSGYDPSNDVRFLEEEIDLWFAAVIERNLAKIKEKGRAAEVLAGLGIRPEHTEKAIEKAGLEPAKLARELRLLSKPIIIAANKMDLPPAGENLEKMRKGFPGVTMVPCCAEAEIALRGAAQAGLISYVPGAPDFRILDEKRLTEKQAKALAFIKESVLKPYGSTGVQECLNRAVFGLLDYIVVYPVENESKFSNKKGQVLPDAHLVPRGSTAKDLAYRIHTDIGKSFIGAVDARTRKRVGADHVLKDGDIISIISASK